jgi:hypothetical protein
MRSEFQRAHKPLAKLQLTEKTEIFITGDKVQCIRFNQSDRQAQRLPAK